MPCTTAGPVNRIIQWITMHNSVDSAAQPAPIRVYFVARYSSEAMYKKLVYLGREGDICLHAVGPRVWQDVFFSATFDPSQAREFTLETVPMIGSLADPHRVLYRTLHASMRRVRPDIVHVEEEPDSLAALQAVIATRLFAPRARLLLHTWQNIDRPMSPHVRSIYRLTLRASAGIFCANRAAVQIVRGHGYTKPVWLLPANGVDTDRFAPCPQPPPQRPFVIGYIGRLVPEKGIDLLIDALAALRQLRPDAQARLRIIGGGPLAETLARQVKQLGLEDVVEFVAGMPPDEIPAALCALSALVLPSRSTPLWQEQLGRVLLEAMAVGVPVIGARSGAIPEVIGDGGLVFDEGDVNQLVEALCKVVDDPDLRQQLVAAGQTHVHSRYTQRYVASQTAAAYRQIMRRATERATGSATEPAEVAQP